MSTNRREEFPLTVRGVADRSWSTLPRRELHLTSNQGKPVEWAAISELWYKVCGTGLTGCMVA